MVFTIITYYKLLEGTSHVRRHLYGVYHHNLLEGTYGVYHHNLLQSC